MNASGTQTAVPTLRPEQMTLTPTVVAVPPAPGQVLSYDAGPAGLAVRLTAQVASRAVRELDGERVWVMANTHGRLIAFQAMARRLTETSMETQGITAPVEESRRGQLRAQTRLGASLRVATAGGDERSVISAQTVDLSVGGCRLQLPVGADRASLPDVGAPADVTIDLAAEPLVASGEMLRVDPAEGQAVVRFTSLAAEDADRIERHVLNLVV